MVTFSNKVNSVAKQLDTIAKNKTLKEFTVLCSVSAATFFAGLAIVVLRAEPVEESMLRCCHRIPRINRIMLSTRPLL